MRHIPNQPTKPQELQLGTTAAALTCDIYTLGSRDLGFRSTQSDCPCYELVNRSFRVGTAKSRHHAPGGMRHCKFVLASLFTSEHPRAHEDLQWTAPWVLESYCWFR